MTTARSHTLAQLDHTGGRTIFGRFRCPLTGGPAPLRLSGWRVLRCPTSAVPLRGAVFAV
jgi:hypothetical protein